jgi:hypothetical protein
MAATRSQPTLTGPANGAVAKAGDAVTTTVRRVPTGALAAGAAAAGLAGGLVLGARARPRRRVSARTIARGARRAAAAAAKASSTADDIRAIRQQLEHANRRSPIEIVLDGLTHRRGAHKLET